MGNKQTLVFSCEVLEGRRLLAVVPPGTPFARVIVVPTAPPIPAGLATEITFTDTNTTESEYEIEWSEFPSGHWPGDPATRPGEAGKVFNYPGTPPVHITAVPGDATSGEIETAEHRLWGGLAKRYYRIRALEAGGASSDWTARQH